MTHEEYLLTLQALVPGSLYCLAGTDYKNIVWEDSRTKPTQAELDAALPNATYTAQMQQVETTRRTQYEAQSDGIYFAWQRGDATEVEWRNAVAKVKADNPYPPALKATK